MSNIKELEFKKIGDSRGDLVALEALKNIPFEIKRVYYLVNTKKDVARGFHAHRKLKQVLICVAGSCRVILDDGFKREDVTLSSFTHGLLINSLIWREMHDFTEDCVLLVIASEHYEESDYLRNYEDFLRIVKDASNT